MRQSIKPSLATLLAAWIGATAIAAAQTAPAGTQTEALFTKISDRHAGQGDPSADAELSDSFEAFSESIRERAYAATSGVVTLFDSEVQALLQGAMIESLDRKARIDAVSTLRQVDFTDDQKLLVGSSLSSVLGPNTDPIIVHESLQILSNTRRQIAGDFEFLLSAIAEPEIYLESAYIREQELDRRFSVRGGADRSTERVDLLTASVSLAAFVAAEDLDELRQAADAAMDRLEPGQSVALLKALAEGVQATEGVDWGELSFVIDDALQVMQSRGPTAPEVAGVLHSLALFTKNNPNFAGVANVHVTNLHQIYPDDTDVISMHAFAIDVIQNAQ